MRQFEVNRMLYNSVQISTAVPLDEAEIRTGVLLRRMSRDEAIVLAAHILEAAGVEYMIDVVTE